MKLNKSHRDIFSTVHDNEFGKGWVSLPNQRPTSSAAMKELRANGLVEYVTVDGWAGNRLTEKGRKLLAEIER